MTSHESELRRAMWLFAAFGLGAGLMFVFDPRSGRRRRALARDKVAHAIHALRSSLSTTMRDLAHRARGKVLETRGRLRNEAVPDDVLEARVRARLGHHVSHSHAIEVDATNGVVTLRGPILTRELDELLDRICRVRGVRDVENQLEAHATGEGIPSLQGGPRPRLPRVRGARRPARPEDTTLPW